MATGWFSKRITFNKYVFSSEGKDLLEVLGNEEIILEWVEYDIFISNNRYFTIYRSRARPWSRELQKILCPEEIKFHETYTSIPTVTRKLKKWTQYNEKQAIRRLVLDRPSHDVAINYFKNQQWAELVQNYDVCPIELSVYLGNEHQLVYEAFMNHEFIKCMKRYCTVWIDDEQASIPILYQSGELCKDKMIEDEKIKTRTKKDDADPNYISADVALKWAVEATPKNFNRPTYPSWHRFINQRVIPKFQFPIVAPVWGTPNRIRKEIDKRYEDGNMIAKAAAPFIKPNEPYIWVNCYTHGLTVKVKETFTVKDTEDRKEIKWHKGQVFNLRESDYLIGNYVCNGTLISFEDVYTKFENCHPCTYEMICEIQQGSSNIVLCTDFNTPNWVFIDANHAAQEKQLLCIHLLNN